MTVGERLKQLREKSGMSQVEFAAKLNVSKQNLYKYENNIITNIEVIIFFKFFIIVISLSKLYI